MTPVKTLGLVTLALLACALLAAVPVFAATSATPAAAVQPPAVALTGTVQPVGAAPGCGAARPTDLFVALAEAGFSAPPERLAGPACTLGDEKANAGKPAGRPFRGFCACSCAALPDCNTSADCGGAACLPARTCC